MSASAGSPRGPAEPPGARWTGATKRERFRRAALASLVAALGLALVTCGPAAVALGWYGLSLLQARQGVDTQVGVETHDGPVSFVVHEIRCGAAEGESVNGKLCRVRMGARNDGPAEVTVPGTAQRLHGAQGARHLPAGVDDAPFGTLEPGEAGTAVIMFDLPAQAAVTHVEMHADPYSPGATVAIGHPSPLLDE